MRNVIYQAVGRGICPTAMEEWTNKKKKDYIFLRLKDQQSNHVNMTQKTANVIAYEGIKYGYFDLIVHAIYILSGKKFWIGKTGDRAKKAQVCSEFVAFIYNEFFREPWKVTTTDIVNSFDFREVASFEDLKSGDIAIEHTYFRPFKNPVSILSFLVRLFTRSYWNHCGIVIVNL